MAARAAREKRMVDGSGREEGYTRRAEEMVVVEEKGEGVGKEAVGQLRETSMPIWREACT